MVNQFIKSIINRRRQLEILIVYSYLKMKLRKNEICLLLNRGHIGDCIYSLSALDELKAAFPGKNIVVVAPEQLKKLVLTYPDIDRIIYYKGPDDLRGHENAVSKYMRQLLQSGYAQNRGLSDGIYNTVPSFYREFWKSENEGARHFLTTKIFKLPGQLVTFPEVKQVPVRSIQGFEKIKSKVVILNPFSISMNAYTESLFVYFAHTLTEKGYFVYTNVIASQEPIPGTLPLRCDLQELYSIASEIPLLVSIRSGVVDYLMQSGINIFVIYELRDSIMTFISNNYSLNEWPVKGKYDEVFLKDDNVETAKKKFLIFLQDLEN